MDVCPGVCRSLSCPQSLPGWVSQERNDHVPPKTAGDVNPALLRGCRRAAREPSLVSILPVGRGKLQPPPLASSTRGTAAATGFLSLYSVEQSGGSQRSRPTDPLLGQGTQGSLPTPLKGRRLLPGHCSPPTPHSTSTLSLQLDSTTNAASAPEALATDTQFPLHATPPPSCCKAGCHRPSPMGRSQPRPCQLPAGAEPGHRPGRGSTDTRVAQLPAEERG